MIELRITTAMNRTPPSASETGAETAARATPKTTIAVPSFRRLSASTTVASRRGERSCLNVAMTAAGSVAETIAPTTNALAHGIPVAVDRRSATMAAVTTTPGTARRKTTRTVRLSSAKSIW